MPSARPGASCNARWSKSSPPLPGRLDQRRFQLDVQQARAIEQLLNHSAKDIPGIAELVDRPLPWPDWIFRLPST
ncbi:protein of unknown function [Pseudomonas sp. JV241A]|nr:protein of unknown function [Pseudomonas sp. JV241A]